MSFSVQNIIGTPLHAVAESNIALAHLNFDFSLVKCEAPAELQLLGKQLSKSRRQSAEDGSFHILARRLGVLFDDVLPDVPVLLEAYGTRASQIVQEMTQKTENPKVIVDGFFGSHLGIDSTTIWASATSGKSVLRMHLLACMLARIWSPQEATAIWAELQIQINLIINNLSVAVKSQSSSNHPSTPKTRSYDSVILNLNRALTTLDKLICGEPQQITDGGILLGLVSWHIYPDLVVLGPKTQEIRQKDILVKESGIVTISITPQARPRTDGVYWSLPLASLRYYGVVHRERSTMRDSRISVAQLQALILGASLGADDAAFTAAKILKSFWNLFSSLYEAKLSQIADQPLDLSADLAGFEVVDLLKDDRQSLRSLMQLLQLIFPFQGGIDLLFVENDNEKNTAMQLMRYGTNYGKSWIGNTGTSAPTFFGLASLSSLLRMIKNREERIKILRAQCKQYCLLSSDYVIRFRTESGYVYTSIDVESARASHGGTKRKRDEYENQDVDGIHLLKSPPGEIWTCFASPEASSRHVSQYFNPDMEDDDSNAQDDDVDSNAEDDFFAQFVHDGPLPSQSVIFNFAFGDHSLAAVYKRVTSQTLPQNQPISDAVSLDILEDLLDKSLLQLDLVAEHILHHFTVTQSSHGRSLLALGRVVDYYMSHLPYATVAMGVIKGPIRSWNWAQSMVKELDSLSPLAKQQAREGNTPATIYPSPLSREYAFAAILQFEAGEISVDLAKLADVLAISSGNSLFIAEQLLHDPMSPKSLCSGAVSHVMGNVGKPGVTLLVSPPEVEIREHDIERWQFVNHNPFDGNSAGGMFDGTSIHLSFTGWEGPVSLESTNSRGMEAYYVETAVSVNDRGEWLGDLDILKGLRDLEMVVLDPADSKCIHDPAFAAAGVKLISIDCWEEILDPPSGLLVLRSASATPATHDRGGNWQWMVRLAAVSIARSRKYRCICLPVDRSFCWTCVVDKIDDGEERNVLLVY
ncbi:hypothetical protein N7517_006385 [Penicillium concentricum]|uniref:Uncharacterized protein n=1 Tax=Penicillium concentricum TaxID=293559 RepID=A0A9W9VBA5_9EURO|nr:uncharacterized protein N7517_006385 [Penicillium concentricum]KAJ5374379.1 hypothetical protein N7517_006385 [Penicillium concentricum]